LPVHEWKRAGRLKPATVVVFFRSQRRCKNPLSCYVLRRGAASMTMHWSTRQAVTQLLDAWSNGDEGALGKLLPMVHPER